MKRFVKMVSVTAGALAVGLLGAGTASASSYDPGATSPGTSLPSAGGSFSQIFLASLVALGSGIVLTNVVRRRENVTL